MKRNLQHIDEVRFLIIHLILINHWLLSLWIAKTNVNVSLSDWWIELTSPCLALLSGYLFFFRTREKFSFKKKVIARWHSLVIPYLAWTLTFFLLFYLMKEGYKAIFHTSYWYADIRPITFPNLLYDLVHPPLVNFWYLQNLILIIPFNFVFYYLLKNNYAFIALFIAVILIYAFKPFDIYFEPRFLPFYLLGCWLGFNEKHVPEYKLNKFSSTILALVLCFLAVVTYHLEYSNLGIILLKVLIACSFLIGCYYFMDSNQNSWIFRYLHKYKDISFFLFAIHMFFFGIVQRGLMKAGAEPYLANKYFTLAFCIGSTLIVLIMSLTTGWLLRKYVPKFYGFITGR